jgi:hypothetical protein
MSESLLLNVSKYAASDKTSPIENFVTEAFAWLLRNDEEARNAILHELKSKKCALDFERSYRSDGHEISTQMNFNGKFPDMVWQDKANDWTLIFEHKVWSELHENQLDNYRAYAETHYPNYQLVLITARKTQHRQDPDVALCWYDIVDVLRQLNKSSEKTQWLRNEFISLIDGNGLNDITPIDPLSLKYYQAAKAIDQQFNNICNSALHREWPLEHYLDFKKQLKIKRSWGRTGFVIAQSIDEIDECSWSPGIFIGFLQDGFDHVAEDLLENGPVAIVILSFGKAHHSVYTTSPIYKHLLEELQAQSEHLNGWEIHDRSQLSDYNFWHPLMITYQLDTLFHSCKSIDAQENRFIDEVSNLQKVLMSCSSFKLLCESLKPRT